MDTLTALLARSACAPLGDCLVWLPGLLWAGGVAGIALWFLMPQLRRARSVPRLQAAIEALHAEAARRPVADQPPVDESHRLAIMLAGIGAGFIATDRAGRVTRLNAVGEQLLGWTAAEARGLGLWQVLDRDDRPLAYPVRNAVEEMVALGTTVEGTQHFVAIARGGARITLEVKAELTWAADGSANGLAMVFRDISRLSRAEAESSRLAAIVESSQDAIIGKSLDGRITSWNSAAQAMLGYTAVEAIGQPVQMLIPPDREAEEMRLLAELARGTAVPAFDTVRRTKTGRLLEVSVAISPIRDADDRIVGASNVARALSLQRRAEAALRDSEARLRFTLDSAEIGDWELDLASGVTQRSLRHDRCFGYSALQAEWSLNTFLLHVHPGDRADVVRTLNLARTDNSDWRTECRVVWPDATVHWIGLHGSIHEANGKPRRMVGIVTDITRQKFDEGARLTALRLEAENRQIVEASRLKSQFLANMSHELRTPLNAIIGFADLLHAGAVPFTSPKHDEFLGHIASSGRHLLQLINDVLDLSKVESGRFEFFPEPLHLPALVKEVGAVLQTSILHKHLTLETEIDPSLEDIVLDPGRLKQTLYNYLSNAIKFTPEGGRITVRAKACGAAHFRMEVEDSGIGIAPADLPRLFGEFQQLDAGFSKQHQGTGLGLALTRRLIEAQGGSVGVASVLGQGSVFHLILNRVHGFDVGLQQGARPDDLRLLVISPEQSDAASRLQAYSEAGFQADLVSTGSQALQHAIDTSYDAITLDLLMPGVRGLGVLAGIRDQGRSRDAPVVGVTLSTGPDAAAAFAIADVLSKPLRAKEVAAAMARFQRPASGRPTVMVIDDDPLALALMREVLEGVGIDVVCLRDGREALRDIEQHRPDAIVLDLTMPEFDGFKVLDALGRLPSWRDTPVFIWTSMVLTDDEYAGLALSARAVLRKGGGALQAMLDKLRRGHAPVVPPPVQAPVTGSSA